MTDNQPTSNNNPKHPNLKGQWQKGQSGNPAGRPKGSRNAISEDFLKALHEDFHATDEGEKVPNGKRAIIECRRKDPSRYVGALVQLQPKHLSVTTDDFTAANDEQLLARIAQLDELIARAVGAERRVAQADENKPAEVLPSLH